MEVKKTFVADGKKYRAGDKPPEMDKTTSDHYQRHGMIGPAEDKQAKKAAEKTAKPDQTKPAEPNGKK
ncbi:hypothetical protein [Noviherbaspirillum malthae]|uniref:hypothetical protein n=1 Tax=Noviherbaspirillum malthae TaxID=1260987 RepID=UPI0018907B90|nr:hypothetical protein [Noviherbaspirillum malthae]